MSCRVIALQYGYVSQDCITTPRRCQTREVNRGSMRSARSCRIVCHLDVQEVAQRARLNARLNARLCRYRFLCAEAVDESLPFTHVFRLNGVCKAWVRITPSRQGIIKASPL